MTGQAADALAAFRRARGDREALAAEAVTEADVAMALFRESSEVGYRAVDIYRAEDVLDSLRSRDDFRLLMMDLAMPAEPFAAAR